MTAEPIRVLELRSVRGTGGGPEKTILLGAARSDPSAFDVTVCYVRDARDSRFSTDTWARDLGVKYVEIIERHSFDVGIWPKLRALVRDRCIEIVHSHDYKTDVLALLLARYENVMPLATAHGWTGHSARERHVYYPVDKRVLARFPKLIAVSGEIRSELVRHGALKERVDVVLNGIDAQAFQRHQEKEAAIRASLAIAPDDIVIGSVGRLEPQKRFDLLVRSFSRLLPKNARMKLLIAGEGSQRGALERLIAELGVSGSCRLLGLRTDVVDLHHAFDLFVQSSDYEGTPNAVLEAMALETPVIATDAGGTCEIVRDGVDGVIVPPGSVELLAAAIGNVLSDSAARQARARNARARVEGELSFSSRVRTVERIYTALAGRRSSAGAAS